MKIISTLFYSDADPIGLPTDLLVTDIAGEDIDSWIKNVKLINPKAVIPPYDPLDAKRTSQCADMAKTRMDNVGVVVAGTSDKEREEFFLWAQENGYAPIVLLPHRHFDRKRQILQLTVPKYIRQDTWVHLPDASLVDGFGGFDPMLYPGRYTTGEEFRRMV